MGSVTLFNSTRMQAIEDGTVTSGLVDVNGHLILTKHDSTQVDAGKVAGSNGISAYQVAVNNGFSGSESDWLASLKGIDGETGIPAGSIIAWPALGIPTNWLECNGQAVSRTTHSDLYAIIGTQYGAGDGSTTFNVPDLRGYVISGYDETQTEFNALGKTGGEKTHLLLSGESGLQSHNHALYGHAWAWGATAPQNNVFAPASVSVGNTPANDLYTSQNFWNVTGYHAAADASSPHNNLGPYSTAKYIIKASGGVGELSSTVESVLLDRVSATEEDITALQVVKPSFAARMQTDISVSGAATWRKINFALVHANRGNCYDSSLSRFTAPHDGLYEFTLSVTPSTSSAGPGFALYTNGHNYLGQAAMGYSVAYNTVGFTDQVVLSSGDYVEVWFNNFNGTSVTLAASYGGLFVGKEI